MVRRVASGCSDRPELQGDRSGILRIVAYTASRAATAVVSPVTDVSVLADTIDSMSRTVAHSSAVASAAKLFCGFGDRTRLSILKLLARGERRVTDIVETLNASQANISGHLKCLKDCGLVDDRRSGREVFYRIAHSEVLDVLRSAEQLLAVTGIGIELCPNYEPEPGTS